ncbi:MAG: DNA translocase FtsK 4TM domain-containing protein [Phycisphaerales bacterium]|nr:MAG: DNA translocase FtsK 4TM domain-containing protein [Phycisphaerales bacterium]
MKKKKKSRSRASRHQTTGTISRTAMRCFGIGVCLVLLCSCLSFDIGDWPSGFAYPHNSPTTNWCGSIGAFCAYYLLYYIGPGVFVILASAICYLGAQLAQRPTNQPVLRVTGLALVTVAASMTFQYFWPHRIFTFPSGSGGVLGVGAAQLLRSHFAVLGTFILVAALWTVGAILLADGLILLILRVFAFVACKFVGVAIPAWAAAKQHSQVLNEIWRELSARQKPPAPATESPKPLVRSEPAAVRPGSDVPRPVDGIPIRTQSAVVPEKPDRPQSSPPKPAVQPCSQEYQLPPLDLLAEPEYSFASMQEKVVKAKASALEKLLSEFNVNARVVAADSGPVVTMFELELAAGVKVSQIASLANDMARALGVGAVRVVAPLPGKHTIGIEVPNSEKERVRIKNLMQLAGAKPQKMQIPLYLGKDSSGEALVSDLTRMPHLLIAGTTGSGKSVCINSIITGVLLTKRPDEVKMILIDPKMVEMTAFNTIPHLMCPIVTETQMAVQILEWATVKMDERYALLAEARVKNIAEFNALDAEEIIRRFDPSSADEEEKIPKKLPYIVIVIDELADLMMTAAKEIEAYIVRLAQKSRAVGIHIVLATQRPQATVVTGLIKSNMPTRIGFRVAARMDSRIILDQNGAETLLGEGDMLFLKPGTSELVRAQGTFMDEAEIKRIVKHLKEIAEPQFHPELTQLKKLDTSEMARDELFDDAVRIVLETKRGSVSLLQRRLNVGYARASRIIEMMAAAGILGEYKGSQAREVMMTLEEYERIREQMEADTEAGYQDLAETADSSEPAYVSEGQQGYMSTDSDDD